VIVCSDADDFICLISALSYVRELHVKVLYYAMGNHSIIFL